MFQPQPTPFAAAAFASYGVGVGQELSGPDYLFAPTPLLSLQSLQNSHSAGPSTLLFAQPPPPSPAAHFSSYNPQRPPIKMDPTLVEDEVAAQQEAARDYQPELEGPLVGEKTDSQAITDEYAKADQVYVNKTMALPHTYSHYRPIQGDGNCGWRAIGFSYFETMIQVLTKQQAEAEVARISSLNEYLLPVGGYDISLFEGMVEETATLLKDIAEILPDRPRAMAILMERFNDRSCSNAIIYHLRLLASSFLKDNPLPYEPFIPDDMGIAGYCQEVIERPDKEIDHLGVVLLANVLLKPVDFVLEIAYLDRSAGTQVNTYRVPEEANGEDITNLGPMIYLLFRPDHYDILYRKPTEIQVHKVTSIKHETSIVSTGPALSDFVDVDFTPLALMPGMMSFASPGVGPSSLGGSFMPTPSPSWLSAPVFSEPVPPPAPLPPPPTQMPPPPQPTSTPTTTTYPLRFSREMTRLPPADFIDTQTFSTNMFKNSHYNKAHYNNPDFHPEEWTPEDDAPERVRRKGRAKQD